MPLIIPLMPGEITLDGEQIAIEGRPPQGTKHEVLFGTLRDTGEEVVIKIERIPDALEREAIALRHLADQEDLVPRLRSDGQARWAGRQVACLVMDRCEGKAPTSRDGWQRMGRALGRLAEPTDGLIRLPALDSEEFGAQHAHRVNELGSCLDAIARATPDWSALTSAEIPGHHPLVLTHGDPGPGNFLDDGQTGKLIDWEDAHVAPRGLDLARLAFIAWLGAGPAGFKERDHDARARATVAGYLQTVPGGWQPSIQETRWWTTVAGIQFIHRRWQLNGQPAPWEQAVEVLQRRLAAPAASS